MPKTDGEPEHDRAWVLDQIRERLRFYSELTTIGPEPPAELARVLGTADAVPASQPGATETVSKLAVSPETPAREGESLDDIRADLGDCTRCVLHQGRQQLVFGVGNPNAQLMFIGEGPGYEEDRQGIPFVGPAGQLLTKIIEAIDLTRDKVYIANVVKCRPPRNRDPEPEEVETCRPFLDRQIDTIKPKVICALGRVSALNLLQTDQGITRIRGKIFPYRGAKLIPTFHPAFLLRNPEKKRDVWEDMKLIRRLLNEL